MASHKWFLNLDGIKGDSVYVGHEDEIDVVSFSYGVSNSGTFSSGGGMGAGKASFSDLNVTTHLGSASPKLFLTCVTGQHIKKAVLTGVTNSGKGKGTDALEVTMEDILVTSVTDGDDPTGTPTEQISLNYAKIEITVTPITSTGAVGKPVTAGYDLKNNKNV